MASIHEPTIKKNDLTSRYLADKEHEDSAEFRKFRRNLFHGSINQILQPLREYMETPDIVRYGDGYYRRTIYGIGPYIADYPEQVLLCCIVQGWCPRYVFSTWPFVSVCDIFLYQGVEHHQGTLIVKTYLAGVHAHTQISFAQDVKWVHYMTIMA